jgi:hypothetical protein
MRTQGSVRLSRKWKEVGSLFSRFSHWLLARRSSRSSTRQAGLMCNPKNRLYAMRSGRDFSGAADSCQSANANANPRRALVSRALATPCSDDVFSLAEFTLLPLVLYMHRGLNASIDRAGAGKINHEEGCPNRPAATATWQHGNTESQLLDLV